MGILLLIGTEKGAFRCSSDGARSSWTVEGPLFKGWKVTASARSASGRYLVATASQVYGPAIHTSADLRAWTQVEHGPAFSEESGHTFQQVWTFATGHDRLFAGVDEAALFVSRDDGESWQPVPALNDHPTRPAWFPGAGGLCAHTVLVDPRRPERLWCGISAVGLWRSDDDGATWHPKNHGIRCVIEDEHHADIGYCVHKVVADPDDADTIWRQDHTGMYRSHDGGDSWERTEEGLPSWFGFPLVLDPATKHLFSFPMESDEYRLPMEGRFAIYRSRDGAATWQAMTSGLPTEPTFAGVLRGAMAVDGRSPGGIYAGTTSGKLFASNDGGESWRALPCTLPRILCVDAYSTDGA